MKWLIIWSDWFYEVINFMKWSIKGLMKGLTQWLIKVINFMKWLIYEAINFMKWLILWSDWFYEVINFMKWLILWSD